MYRMPRFTGKHTIEDTRAFLHQLGDPDRKLRIIYVAGTNGKGSVCAYMRSILEEAGRKVAVFTSPHLVDIRERFVVEGKMPTKEAFLEAFLDIYNCLDWQALEQDTGYHPSFFEYLFFMGMLLFEKAAPDYCILETGLGGRLDATNSVSAKEIAVITHISLDHVEYLGHTPAAIAGEKAGIIHEGAPVVYLDTDADISAVIEAKAASLGVKAYPVSKKHYANLKIHNKSIDFSLKYRYDSDISVTLATIALYQAENAALAVQAIRIVDSEGTITADQVKGGLAKCFWAGRMEEVLPDVYVDGAHNEDGVRAFLESVAADGCYSRCLLFSAVTDKDYPKMLQEILGSGLFEKVVLVPMTGGRAASLEELQEAAADAQRCSGAEAIVQCMPVLQDAFRQLVRSVEAERLYVAGSLYLVGEIKELVEHDQF